MKWDLKFPEFYEPRNAENSAYFREIGVPGSKLMDLAEVYRKKYKVPFVGGYEPNIVATFVDMNRDFCDPNGSLAVVGAMNDLRRLVEFVYRNLRYLKQIVLTADSHPTTMVTTPHFLIDSNGSHPNPFTEIFHADFILEKWRVNPTIVSTLPGGYSEEFINEFLFYYTGQLMGLKRPNLLIWPEHCRTATHGQMLMGALDEAVMFHEYVRGTTNPVITKGECPYLECFAALGPDILTFQDGTPIPLAQENIRLIEILSKADAWIVGGQASTHCVPATALRVLEKLPHLAKNTYYLTDGMSPVTGLEFLADKPNERLKELGVHFVKSTDSLEKWTGVMPELISHLDRKS